VLLSDSANHHVVKIVLVVSVYEYGTYYDDDCVQLRIALYFDSFGTEPDYEPYNARYVHLYVDKNNGGQDFHNQSTSLELSTRAGYSQGAYLAQRTSTSSTLDDREFWAAKPIGFAVGLLCEPLDILFDLIDMAEAFAPEKEWDFHDATVNESHAFYDWGVPLGIAFDGVDPVREYCLNSVRWLQTKNVNPLQSYSINVSARVVLATVFGAPTPFGDYVDMPPITLTIRRNEPHTVSIRSNAFGTTNPAPGNYTQNYDYPAMQVVAVPSSGYEFLYWVVDGTMVYSPIVWVDFRTDHVLFARFLEGGWGGGCPTVFVWNGTDYNDFGVLNIHNPDGNYDVVREIPMPVGTVGVNNYVAKIRLQEGWVGLNSSHSDFDQVKLYAVVNGVRRLCPLIYANHSRLGNVLPRLLFSDDWKVGADLLETIDLKFLVPYQNAQEYFFVVEGINHFKR
jgi:hypothetical protein